MEPDCAQVPNPRVATALTSTSIERAPGPSSSFVRGKSGHVPFWPGGLDGILKAPEELYDLHEDGGRLRTVAPGLSRGLRLSGDDSEDAALADLGRISDESRRKDDHGVFTDLVNSGFALNTFLYSMSKYNMLMEMLLMTCHRRKLSRTLTIFFRQL